MHQHTLRGLRRTPHGAGKQEERLCLSTRYMGCVALGNTGELHVWSFASAHAAWVALALHFQPVWFRCALPQHTLRGLHSSSPLAYCMIASFASAHAAWVAFAGSASTLRAAFLCLSTRCVGCIRSIYNSVAYSPPLPQHTLRGLHCAAFHIPINLRLLCLSTRCVGCIESCAMAYQNLTLCLSTRCVGCIGKNI